MNYLVYQITNTINGKSYIGCHKTDNRNDGYFGSGKALKASIKKHGIGVFRKDILFEASSLEEMFAKEKELVVLGPKSYNLKEGGTGGFPKGASSLGGKHSVISNKQNHRGFFNPNRDFVIIKEWGAKGGRNNRGISKSASHKEKIGLVNSQRNKGRKCIHHPITLHNRMIGRGDSIPEGWLKGRKRKFV